MIAPFPRVDGSQACAYEDPELFFPVSTALAAAEPAIEVCRSCRFVRPCLAYALTHQEEGVWGATTADQRRALRIKHGLEAAPVAVPAAIASDVAAGTTAADLERRHAYENEEVTQW